MERKATPASTQKAREESSGDSHVDRIEASPATEENLMKRRYVLSGLGLVAALALVTTAIAG
ncbi:MAG: hypothetical protein ACXWD7_06615, partial [Solirubrobacterales bacterium]